MIRGEAVGLERYEVVVQAVFKFKPSEHDVVQRRHAVIRHLEADY